MSYSMNFNREYSSPIKAHTFVRVNWYVLSSRTVIQLPTPDANKEASRQLADGTGCRSPTRFDNAISTDIEREQF